LKISSQSFSLRPSEEFLSLRRVEIVKVGRRLDGEGEEGQWHPAGCRFDPLLRRGVGACHPDQQGYDLRRLSRFFLDHLSGTTRRLAVDVRGLLITHLRSDRPEELHLREGAKPRLHPLLLTCSTKMLHRTRLPVSKRF